MPSGLGNAIRIKRFHEAIKGWFDHQGRAFDANYYINYNEAYKEWEYTFSVKNIEHQLSHPKSEGECEQCRSIPEPKKPRRSDYFPKEPTDCLLSEVACF